MIIDLHAHTSNHVMRNLHVTSASIDTLEKEAQKYGISRIYLLATYFPLKGTGVHNLDLQQRIEGHPLFGMFGSLDVMNNLESGITELEMLGRDSIISGIKLYCGYQGFEPSERRLDGVYDIAEKYNLPIMLHGGELHECCPTASDVNSSKPCNLNICRLPDWQDLSRPKYVEKPAKAHPNINFIVSHLANPYFSELRDVMKSCPNVSTDISGQFVSGTHEDTIDYRKLLISEIHNFLSTPNGYERVMFASDFPIQSYKDTFELIDGLGLSNEVLNNILFQNALNILGRTQNAERRRG